MFESAEGQDDFEEMVVVEVAIANDGRHDQLLVRDRLMATLIVIVQKTVLIRIAIVKGDGQIQWKRSVDLRKLLESHTISFPKGNKRPTDCFVKHFVHVIMQSEKYCQVCPG